jgi:hypothetical protein
MIPERKRKEKKEKEKKRKEKKKHVCQRKVYLSKSKTIPQK